MKKTLLVILAFAVGVAVAMAAFYLFAPKKEEAKGVEPQSGAQPPPRTKADMAIEILVPGTIVGEPKRA